MNKIKSLLILTLMLIIFPLNLFATTKVELRTDKTELTVGDEITISVNIPNDNEYYAVLASLEYDENIFEKIDDSNFDIDKDKMDISYNSKNNKFGIINKSGKLTTELFNVHLKVKEDTNVGDTTIALTGIKASDGKNNINFDASSVKVTVTRDAKPGETIQVNEENKIKEEKENIIKTLNTTPFLITLSIITLILTIITICSCIYNRKNKKTFIALAIIDILLMLVIGLSFFLNDKKKDVNNDGVKDYNDAKSIIDYLIDIQNNNNDSKTENNNTTEIKFNNDVNNDGVVDVKDPASLVPEINNSIKVKLEEKSDEENYITKGEEITLKFKADINKKDITIKQVKISDNYYDVTLNNDTYIIKLETPKTAGKYTFEITEVVLNNGLTEKANLKITKEILKDTPYVNKFNLDDKKQTLSFELEDKDDAFINGTATIYKDEEKIKSVDVNKDKTTIKFDANDGETYVVKIIGNYDLDSKTSDNKNEYNNQDMFTETFTIGGDYNFTLKDASITDVIAPNETPIISFNSENNRNAQIVTANMTTKETTSDYHITKIDGNNYEVELTGASTTPGMHTVTLNNVGLSSLKTFYNNQDYKANTLTYTVLKDAPKIETLTLSDNHTEKNINVTYKLIDDSKSTNKLTIVLVDSTNKIVDKKEITKKELKIGENSQTSLSYKNNQDGFYTVKVLADYNLSDNYKYTNISLKEQEILVTTSDDIYISEMYIEGGNNYPTKGQKNLSVIFKVHVGDTIKNIAPNKYGGRRYNQLQTITINGLNYSVSTVNNWKDDTFTDYLVRANLNVPNESGIIKIKANRVQLGISGYYNMTKSDMYSVEEKELTIDVLKDTPKIENLKITDNYNENEATFDFDLTLDKNATKNENDFNSGTINLDGISKPIKPGHNTITLKGFKKDENLDLTFNGNYDLDTDTLPEDPDKNTITNKELLKLQYGLYEKEIYDKIEIKNVTFINENNNEYFEKNEQIKINLDITGIDKNLDLIPEKLIIDNEEYTITKLTSGYELILNTSHNSGRKELTITDILLNNGKKVTLNEPYNITYEVLKDIPTINDFTYGDLTNKVKVTLDLKDLDNTLINKANVIITDELGNVVYNEELTKEFTFNREDNTLKYYIEVLVAFDRDIDKTKNSSNYHENVTLLKDAISLNTENIALKDINDINLYKSTEKNGAKEITLIDETSKNELDQDLNSYFIEIIMKNMSTVRAKIKETKVVDNHLILILDNEYLTISDIDDNIDARINFGKIKEDGKVTNEIHPSSAFKALLEELELGANVELTRDYDASAYSVNTDYYIKDYSGNLNGNGHTIKNLTKPLFDTISNGKIENLKLEDITLSGNTMKGTLANTVTKEEIKEVFMHHMIKENTTERSGSLLGSVTDSTIESCKVTDFNFPGGGMTQQLGGLIGYANNTTVKNTYVIGSLSTGWNYRGGLIGMATGCTIENNYTKINFGYPYGDDYKLVSGILTTNSHNNTIINNISINNATNIISNDNKNKDTNYFVSDTLVNNLPDNIIKVTSNEINTDLFKTKLKFDESIWNLNNTSINTLPTLLMENKSDFENIKGYEKEKEVLYKNLSKLMPFYDKNKIIELANITNNELLIEDEIYHIIPVNQNNNIVTYLTTDNPKAIDKIKLIFKSGNKKEYNVSYDKTYDMVATYKINELNLDYNYNNYVINASSQVVNNLTNYLKGLDYTNNLDILTTNNDSRIYRDFYNETTKNELKDFVLKYLSNSNYTNTTNDIDINSHIEREVKENKKIEKALYVYNYFRRFYDLDINGMKLYDFVMYNMKGFNENLTLEKIIDLYMGDGTGSNFNTNVTGAVYKNFLSGYTNLTRISNFLEYIVTHTSDINMNDWIKSQFKGILVEIPIENHEEIEYTLWDHFSNEDAKYNGDSYAVYNYVLPILTLPESSTYIISAPAQFTIGSQRVYMANPTDPTELENFKNRMQVYIERITSYYSTAINILEDKDLFNNIHLYQVDKRTTKNENGVSIYNNPYTTEEPFHKNFDEVVNIWPASYGVNAGNWGDRIEWNVAGFMDSDIKNDGKIDAGHPTWATWSHESAHYLDARLFLKDNERRYDAGGEDYADEFLMQKFGMGIVMNLSINYNEDTEVATNLTPERINSKDKIYSYYNRMFNSIYVLDYIEAMAFLKLTKEEQQTLGIQISYPNENKQFATIDGESHNFDKEPEKFIGKTYKDDEYAKFRARLITQYTRLSDLEDIPKLTTINDLIKNRIMLYTNVTTTTSRGDNSYGGEGIDIVHWYQPNNPDGRPDSYSLKWFSYEMLGYKGYDEGFVEYASNINYKIQKTYKSLLKPNDANGNPNLGDVKFKSDDMAITKISDGQYKTIDDYKIGRFKETHEKIKYLKYINVDEYAKKMYDALVEDAQNNDKSYKASAKIRKEIYFKLKRSTNDFREDIFNEDEEQQITFNTNMFD